MSQCRQVSDAVWREQDYPEYSYSTINLYTIVLLEEE